MGQRDPLNEYKQEGLELFQHMLDLARRDAAKRLSQEPLALWESFQGREEELKLQVAAAKGGAVARGVDPTLVQIDEIVLSVFPHLINTKPMDEEEVSLAAKAKGLPNPNALPIQSMQGAAVRALLNQDKALPPWPEGVDPTKVRRNDPCPCGSGKKFKHCHGKTA